MGPLVSLPIKIIIDPWFFKWKMAFFLRSLEDLTSAVFMRGITLMIQNQSQVPTRIERRWATRRPSEILYHFWVSSSDGPRSRMRAAPGSSPGRLDLSPLSHFSSGQPDCEEGSFKQYIHQVAAAGKTNAPGFSDNMEDLR